jgi:CO/xanthine dehydrogenase Mo-binding subunit
MADRRVVGRSPHRLDGEAKVTGATRYVSDLTVPGMAVGKMLRLPFPHGRISYIDVGDAANMPGVHAVVTAADLGSAVPRFGPLVADQPVLADGRIRYQGEPVAAVVADDESSATRALEAIVVECEQLPAVSSLPEALAPGAPLVFDTSERDPGDPWRDSNVLEEFRFSWGDIPTRPPHVLENTYTFQPVHQYPMEPHVCIASWEGDRLIVWSGVQHPFVLREVLATMLALPLSQVRVLVPQIGGSFGAKGYPKIEPLAAVLARVAHRPVKLQLTSEEGFLTARRAAASIVIRTAFDDAGVILSQDVAADFLIGAYRDISPRVVGKAAHVACGPYRTPAARIVARAVSSHTTPSTAARGFGAPQFTWALESQMDEIAHLLGLDPVEMRLRNLVARGEELIPGDLPADGDWSEGLRRAAAEIGWTEAREPGRGRGIAAGIKSSRPGTASFAEVRLQGDGRVIVLLGTTEMGQGSRTVMAQIAAEVLRVPLERVFVPEPDTDSSPFDSITASSRSTVLAGRAVEEASRDLLRRLETIAAGLIGRPNRLDADEPQFVIGAETALSYEEVLARYFGTEQGVVIGQGASRAEPGGLDGPTPFWEVSFAASEVKVDSATGVVSVLRHVGVSDVGCAINTAQTHEQHYGAAMMGIGHTLREELRYESGQLLNPNLIDYRLPTVQDVPRAMESVLVENSDGPGPFGAKGAGESGIIPVAPSIANALFDAAGARIRDLPLSPERVWRALADLAHREAGGQISEQTPGEG